MRPILLASTYFMALDPKQNRRCRPYPPLGTLYAAATLRQRGFDVAVFDAMVAPDEMAFADALVRHAPSLVFLYEDSFNFLSKMCLERMRRATLAMAECARRSGAHVVVAGSDMTDHPETYLEGGADLVLAGEADETACEIAEALLHGGRDVETIDGVVWLDRAGHGRLRRTPARMPERHLDRLPFPAWDLIDLEPYRRAWNGAHGYFSLNMVSTRGCPFHCNWCAKPIWGQRYAIRSPEQVAEELALVKRTHAPDHIWFADDIFGLRPEWVTRFADEVAARDARVPFTIQSRVDLMTPEAVGALAASGCREVWLGVESGSQRVLHRMEKGIRVEDIAPARRRLRDAGVRACFFLQFGYPGETFEDIMLTVELVRELMPDDIGVSVSYPLPGTTFYERVQTQLGTKTNWTDSGDLAMMFQGTYSTRFYRTLHDLIHRELEVKQALGRGGATPLDVRRLEELSEAWDDLARSERSHRSPSPIHLAMPIPRPLPDLSENWN